MWSLPLNGLRSIIEFPVTEEREIEPALFDLEAVSCVIKNYLKLQDEQFIRGGGDSGRSGVDLYLIIG